MLPTVERDEILEFIKNSPRGIVKGYGTGKRITLIKSDKHIINSKNILMATTADIKKGLCIEYSNDIYKIIEFLNT